MITFRKCCRAKYEEMLDMLHTVFGEYDFENPWFPTHLPNCTPYPEHAVDDEIQRHYIAESDGKVVGALGAYPSVLRVSENRRGGAETALKAFGIGQVSCLKEYRNQGIMTRMMETAMADMIEQGCVIGYLGGDRFRYGRFGFDYGGSCAAFDIRAYRFGEFVDGGAASVRKADFADWRLLNDLYMRLPSYIERSERAWRINLCHREPYAWYIGGDAYICVYENRIVETSGDATAVKRLIRNHMAVNGMDKITVLYPECGYTDNGLYNELWRVSYGVAAGSRNVGLVSVCNPEKLLDDLHPIIDRMYTVNRDEGQRLQLLKYLFGNPAQPALREISGMEHLRPFVFWVPKPDDI
jgi:GNAT superfamily N-acetyltransferase